MSQIIPKHLWSNALFLHSQILMLSTFTNERHDTVSQRLSARPLPLFISWLSEFDYPFLLWYCVIVSQWLAKYIPVVFSHSVNVAIFAISLWFIVLPFLLIFSPNQYRSVGPVPWWGQLLLFPHLSGPSPCFTLPCVGVGVSSKLGEIRSFFKFWWWFIWKHFFLRKWSPRNY